MILKQNCRLYSTKITEARSSYRFFFYHLIVYMYMPFKNVWSNTKIKFVTLKVQLLCLSCVAELPIFQNCLFSIKHVLNSLSLYHGFLIKLNIYFQYLINLPLACWLRHWPCWLSVHISSLVHSDYPLKRCLCLIIKFGQWLSHRRYIFMILSWMLMSTIF